MESSFDAFVYGNNLSSLSPSVTSLPAYTRRPSPPPRTRRELTEHAVELPANTSSVRAKKPWATLRVYSKAPAGTLPTFVEGEKINGSVTLDSSSSNSRHISSVKIRGELATGSHEVERYSFLDCAPVTLWSSKSASQTRESGQHWQFSIDLPRHVITSSGAVNDIHAYSLPPTFMERKIRASIRYTLIVHIQRSTFREDSDLQTAFIYVPAIRPDPPSPLRLLAYQENSPLLGPRADPKGWYSLPSAKVYGKLFNNRIVEVTCRLSLARPLSYTRGSVIPLSLVLTSKDYQALDLLSSPRVLTVILRRKVINNENNLGESKPLWKGHIQTEISREPAQDIATAVWWQRPDDEMNIVQNTATPRTRELEGEILLSKSLKPTFHISHFGIEYSVAMLPFATTSFVPSTTAQRFHNGPILEQRVEIATMFPKGPRPIAHSPPEYREQAPNSARSSLPPSRASLPPSRGR
ncbi:hypothetical protein BT96DRAFT_812587 [Gymnopus androsaceus JB14]|uniref:Arrestin-like N-terminal domain-containing protein n=1 Tax=Gymnopus androsaceus JB14 TaxID=1447944 RepID=A0A6A4I3U7_9AGAR|nr:hypothetical protein BT96DRAFT_812587 [Gymnopus androsaceus JB14]